jgi:hypothetical protein
MKVSKDDKPIELDHHGRCPSCNASWDGGAIFDVLRTQDWCADKSDEELQKYIEDHYSPPYRFSRIVGVELPHDHPEHYDGVSYWQCPYCRHQWPRFLSRRKR